MDKYSEKAIEELEAILSKPDVTLEDAEYVKARIDDHGTRLTLESYCIALTSADEKMRKLGLEYLEKHGRELRAERGQ